MGLCIHYEGTQLTNSSKSDQIRMWSGLDCYTLKYWFKLHNKGGYGPNKLNITKWWVLLAYHRSKQLINVVKFEFCMGPMMVNMKI